MKLNETEYIYRWVCWREQKKNNEEDYKFSNEVILFLQMVEGCLMIISFNFLSCFLYSITFLMEIILLHLEGRKFKHVEIISAPICADFNTKALWDTSLWAERKQSMRSFTKPIFAWRSRNYRCEFHQNEPVSKRFTIPM